MYTTRDSELWYDDGCWGLKHQSHHSHTHQYCKTPSLILSTWSTFTDTCWPHESEKTREAHGPLSYCMCKGKPRHVMFRMGTDQTATEPKEEDAPNIT